MTASKEIEHRITRELLRRREAGAAQPDCGQADRLHLSVGPGSAWQPTDLQSGFHPWADRVIGILAVTAGLLVVGSYHEELLWLVLATATAFTLR